MGWGIPSRQARGRDASGRPSRPRAEPVSADHGRQDAGAHQEDEEEEESPHDGRGLHHHVGRGVDDRLVVRCEDALALRRPHEPQQEAAEQGAQGEGQQRQAREDARDDADGGVAAAQAEPEPDRQGEAGGAGGAADAADGRGRGWGYAIVLTKVDKLGGKPDRAVVDAVARAVASTGVVPVVPPVPTSSKSKLGRDDVWRLLRCVMLEEGGAAGGA